jgi:hypothetical protein
MSKKKTTLEFVNDSKLIFGEKYSYSLVDYNGNNIKVKIVCPIHGEFEVRPFDHLSKKVGCNKCNNAGISKKNNIKKSIIDRFNKKHKNFYDYSLVDYDGTDKKVIIICPIHGEFKQTPHHHLSGSGCPECKGVKQLTTDSFIKKAKEIHGDSYDYSKVNYVNNRTKVKIICPIHGVFEQSPNDHLNKKTGCPICLESGGENIIREFLIKNNINYKYEKRFLNCRNILPLPFDFYLPDFNICIEYDGRQHFEPIGHWGGKKTFIEIQKRDKIKTEFCIKNNIKLIRINYNDNIQDKLKRIYYI